MQNGNTIIFATIVLGVLAILLILMLVMIFNKRKSAEKPLNKKESERKYYKQTSGDRGISEIPDDPDEAMAWLENMARNQEEEKK